MALCPPFVRFAVAASLAALIAPFAAGCRGDMPRLEGDAEVRDLGAKVKPGSEKLKLAVSSVEFLPRAADLDSDSSRCPAKVNREQFREGLRKAIATFTPFKEPGVTGGTDLEASFAEAFYDEADVLIQPVLTRLDCVFRGRNGLWVPNILLWIYAWVPAWWVPDEDYAVEGELALNFYSVPSQRLLYTKKVPIDGEWPLDDFERGWSLTGIITAPKTVDLDDWGIVSESLAPLARFQAEKGAVLEVGKALPAYLRSKDFAEKDGSVFALCCGLSRHAGGIAGPAGAGRDAERFAAFLQEGARVPAKNVLTLVDQRSTAQAVEQGFTSFLGRSRPRDTAVIYWSGLGAAEGERYVLPYDVDPNAVARTAISLKRLRELLAKVPAQRAVVILDASFGGQRPGSRSLTRGPAAELLQSDAALAKWTEGHDGKDVTLILASAPGEDAIDLEGASRGLLSFLLEEGARGAADEDRNGIVTAGELEAYVEREVPSQAGLDGISQHPCLFRGGRRAAPLDPGGREPWLPNADLGPSAPGSPASETSGQPGSPASETSGQPGNSRSPRPSQQQKRGQ